MQEPGCGVPGNLAAAIIKLQAQKVKQAALDIPALAIVLHGINDALNKQGVFS